MFSITIVKMWINLTQNPIHLSLVWHYHMQQIFHWIVLFNAFIAPWLWGCNGVPKIWSTPITYMYDFNLLLLNSFTLSVRNISGYSLIKTWAIAFLTVIACLFLIGIAQAYFEKWSIQVHKYLNLPFILRLIESSTKSTWYLL